MEDFHRYVTGLGARGDARAKRGRGSGITEKDTVHQGQRTLVPLAFFLPEENLGMDVSRPSEVEQEQG